MTQDTQNDESGRTERFNRVAGVMVVWAVTALLVLSVLSPAVALVGTTPTAQNPGVAQAQTSGETVYAGNSTGHVMAIDSSTGDVLWSIQPHNDTVGEVLLTPDGESIITTSVGEVKKINLSSQTVEWARTDYSTKVPAVDVTDNGRLFMQPYKNSNNLLTENSLSDGSTIWTNNARSWDEVTVSGNGDHLYSASGFDPTNTYRVDPDTGTEQTQLGYSTNKYVDYWIANGDGTSVYVSELNTAIYSIDGTDGTTKWSVPIGGIGEISYDETNKRVFFADGTGYGVIDESGTKLWEETQGTVSGMNRYPSAISPDGSVVTFGMGSQLITADMTDGTISSNVTTSQPVTALTYGPGTTTSPTPTETATPEPSEKIRLDAPVYMDHGETDNYTVSYEANATGWSDVTTQATVTSDQPDLVSVQGTTLVATNNTSKAGRALVTASYANETAVARVTVANATVQNIQYLPNTYRFTALLSDSTLYWLLLSTLVGVAAGRYTSAFGALGAGQLALTVGWLGGYVSWAIAATSLFVALFIGLNLAQQTQFAGGNLGRLGR